MRRIIIRGLNSQYDGFITAIRGWPTQPSLVELENLLANQESLTKQMSGVSLKNEEDALFSKRKGGIQRQNTRRNFQHGRSSQHQGVKFHQEERSSHSRGAQPKEWKGEHRTWSSQHQNDGCYICGKKGHFARDC